MCNLLSLYVLHPISNRLANKAQRFYPRYELTNPTKTPPPPFVFSLLSVILLHLHYTLQPLSTLFSIPFSLCYYPPSSCYPVSSSPVTIPCSFVTLSPLTLSLFHFFVALSHRCFSLLFLVYESIFSSSVDLIFLVYSIPIVYYKTIYLCLYLYIFSRYYLSI